MPLRRRDLPALPFLAAGGLLCAAAPAQAARREVEDLGLSLELPDDWVPIPRAEILEARERALAAGAASDWTVRAAWQPPPHLRWFTLPHLTLESRPPPAGDGSLPAAADADSLPVIEQVVGRSGQRSVYTSRAGWRHEGVELRLSLLSFDDRHEAFAQWVASLQGPVRR